MAPLFSIITVTLNCAEAAAATARSVLAQRGADLEYLVKDGGSHDGTAERLRDLGVRVVARPDTGIYDAMNQALVLCSGRYVCFLNAGDTFPDDRTLARVGARLAALGYPELAYGDVRSLSAHPQLPGQIESREIQYPARLGRFYLFRRMVCHQAWFVRREAYLTRGGFDTRYRLLADYDFLLRLLAAPGVRVGHVPAVTAVFQGGGASDQDRARVQAERHAIQARAFRSFERAFYSAAYYGGRALLSELLYRRIYPRLSPAARRRLHGW
jgi:glycosyltransferase involved in cell wall biosynthesis